MTRALIPVLCVLLWSAPATAQATNQPVTIDDVIQLAQSGISDETMITFLDTREIGFVPSAEMIVRLRAAGVSEDVICYLLERTAAVPAPVPPPPVTYAPGYGYPLAYYSPGYYAAGIAFSVGFPILPHWLHDHHFSLHDHHISHVTVGHVFAGNAGLHHGSVAPFSAPLRSIDGHGITRVGLSPLTAGHTTSAGHIGTVHGQTAHSVISAGGAIHGSAVGHGSGGHSGGHNGGGHSGSGHAGGHGGGHAGGHSGGHSGGHGGR